MKNYDKVKPIFIQPETIYDVYTHENETYVFETIKCSSLVDDVYGAITIYGSVHITSIDTELYRRIFCMFPEPIIIENNDSFLSEIINGKIILTSSTISEEGIKLTFIVDQVFPLVMKPKLQAVYDKFREKYSN